jgi:hypothetical protein
MNWPNKLVLDYNRLEMPVRDKHSSLLDPLVSYKKMKGCEYAPSNLIICFYKAKKSTKVPSTDI